MWQVMLAHSDKQLRNEYCIPLSQILVNYHLMCIWWNKNNIIIRQVWKLVNQIFYSLTWKNYLRQRNGRLVWIIIGRRDVDKHEGFCVTTEGILHQHGQLIVTIWNKLLFTRQSWYHISQSWEGLVYRHGFLVKDKNKFATSQKAIITMVLSNFF